MPSVTAADGPVAVTGASGYIGAHSVIALLKRGYHVRACVTDASNPEKTEFLLALADEHPGTVSLHEANLLEDGSYDAVFKDCCAVLHVGTPMGYGGANNPQQVYDGAINGVHNIVGSVRNSGTVKRLVYTSSFAAIGHPSPPGHRYTEADWASDNREDDKNWNTENLVEKGEVGYAMAKVECEHLVNRLAAEDGRFDAISVCPCVVLGPLLTPVHELRGSMAVLPRPHAGRAPVPARLAGVVEHRRCPRLRRVASPHDRERRLRERLALHALRHRRIGRDHRDATA